MSKERAIDSGFLHQFMCFIAMISPNVSDPNIPHSRSYLYAVMDHCLNRHQPILFVNTVCHRKRICGYSEVS